MAAPQSAVQGVPSDVEEVQVKQPEQQVSGVPSDVDEGAAVIPPPVTKPDNFVTRAKALPGQLLETSKERLNDPTTPENKIVAPTLHAIGLPASSQEAQAKQEEHKAHVVRDAVLNYPPVAAGRMVYDMAGNLIRGQQEGAKEAHEAVQNVKEGGPILPNLGKAAYGYLHQTLSGIPFIGGNIERGGEAVHEGDIPKAIGETGAAIIQVAAPDAIHAAGELPRTGTPTYDRFANNYLKPLVGEPRTPTPEVPASPEVRQAAPLARLKQYNVPSEAQSGEALGRIAAPTVETPDQEITPEVAAQSAADKGIKPVTRHAAPTNSPMNKYDVVNNATESPKAPSANETLNLPENTVRPGKQEALPPAPEQKLLPEKTAAVPLPASSIEGVPADVEGVPVAHPETNIAKTEEPGKIIDQAKTAEPAEKLEEKTKGRAEEVAEKYPVPAVGLTKDPFAAPEEVKAAEPKPETGGTAEGAKVATEAGIPKVAATEEAGVPKSDYDKLFAEAEAAGPQWTPEKAKPIISDLNDVPGLEVEPRGSIGEGKPSTNDLDIFFKSGDESLAADTLKSHGFKKVADTAHGSTWENTKTGQAIDTWVKTEPVKSFGEAPKAEGLSDADQGEVANKLTDTEQRGLEKRLGAEAAADTTPEGREKQQRLLKGTMQQYADFANEQGPEKPGGGEWEASDFSKKGTGKKEVPANKKLVIDHAMKNVPHDEFMGATSEWGPPNLEEEEKTTKNASGESSASKEAINRTASEKSQGLKRVVVDTRSGQERPLIGVDTVDYSPQPYESVEFRGGDRDGEVIDSGKNARPYTRKSPLQKYGKSSGNPLDKYHQ